MYSFSYLCVAARSGFYAYQASGDRLTPQRAGFHPPEAGWAWWTGHETARTRQSLTACYRTIRERKRHG